MFLSRAFCISLGGWFFCGIAASQSSLAQSRLEQAQPEPVHKNVDYRRDIQPILSRNCFTCHGPDEGTREANLRLDQPASVRVDVDSPDEQDAVQYLGSVVLAGQADQSELYSRIVSADESIQMPPTNSGRQLTPAEISAIQTWINEGATQPPHWSFVPPVHPPVPRVADSSWPTNAIDHFVLSRLEYLGVAPSLEADRETLIRRLSLDLLGLPPTIDEVDTFIHDEAPHAYQRLVDQMLASPHFGERWGKHWLDLARYADSDGYLGDPLRPYAFLYRDWVIDAINQDQPVDQFSIQQLAGDLIPNATLEQKIATGFHRNAAKNTEAGADREEDRVNRMVNYVSTIGTTWLGMTVGCAECHTHKYDPISHHEFYRLYAFFNNTEERDVSAATDQELSQYQLKFSKWAEQLAEQKRLLDMSVPTIEDLLPILDLADKQRKTAQKQQLETFFAGLDEAAKQAINDYQQVAHSKPIPPATKAQTIAEVPSDKRRATKLHVRGSFRNPGDEVFPATPQIFHPMTPRGQTPDRLDLANWLFDPANPLTHRTTVNRLWKHLMGRGLVATPDNLGTTGDAPTHPELLDYLAIELVRRGWSRKDMIREIVSSTTYRQSSTLRPELIERDPHNTWLARQSRFRVEAEVVRDLALAAGGQLHTRIGGPSIRPPLDIRVTNYSRNKEWQVSPGADQYRRGLYVLIRRNTPYSMLITFDAPDTSVTCAQRERTHSPLQALTLLNDPVFRESAQQLGRLLAIEGGDQPMDWITRGFKRCLGRQPNEAETGRLVDFYQAQLEMLADTTQDDLQHIVGEPINEFDIREQAARVAVARCLINVNEFITRE